ncbi:MAG TPA: histidine kinase [Frateuria sp.]|nr:histidine kinase [Frateuria sp.]
MLLATLLLWAVAFVAWTADTLEVPFSLDRALRRLPLCAGGALLCLGLGRLLGRVRGQSAWRTGGWAALGVALASVLYALANELALYVIRPHWGPPRWAHIPSTALMALWVFAAWVLLYLALDADAQRRDREVRLAQADAAAIDAQHRLLLQQLNPHFLFNALNTVYALVVEGDEAGARRSLLALSDFLRASLERDPPAQVTLAQELDSVRHYLTIELQRFSGRLQLVEAIPPELLGRRLPPMVLQPLVENCIKHGLACAEGAMTIRLSAATVDEGWVLRVEDDGRAAAPPRDARAGVGLGNIARRLQLLYGAAARLEARALAGGGFVAYVHLPGAGA